VRYDSGGSLLIEPAGGPLLLYVLDGELIYSGRRLWRGAAESIPGSAAAAEARSDIGCTLLCVQSESPPSAQPSSA
jgi:hypothetical protein